ncbi:hypothetical protein FALBO_6747 [Fusarium albosuccineum]|uniref:Uncharacterized protein n=1 Tax=Fusarium albosuccineum TaxID=1237068 RepID=A0A8H4LEA7_9HYPO|nr:hypothetical protein FALBO_6747 [Fusarium albosuccineum]
MPELQRILDALYDYPVGEQLSDNRDQYLTNWGFTIYRTYYGPSSDENWNTLLATAKKEADEELLTCGDDNIAKKLQPLFRLDARSDASLLDGVGLRGLCKIYKDKIGGAPMPTHETSVFLVADEHVLNQIGQGNFIVKAVDADEPPPEDAFSNEGGKEMYWGWMRMQTRQLLELWGMLEICAAYMCITWAVHNEDLDSMIWEGGDAD